MTILFVLLGIIALIIAFVLIAGLFIKKEYVLEQRIVIEKPAETVFNFIRMLKNQQHYNTWWRIDPTSKKEFKGIDGTVGAVAMWDSANKKAGKGEQEIVHLDENKRIDHELRFEKPFEGVANAYMIVEKLNGGTSVKWGFYGVNKYPMNVMFILLGLGKSLANDLAASLEKLKCTLEK